MPNIPKRYEGSQGKGEKRGPSLSGFLLAGTGVALPLLTVFTSQSWPFLLLALFVLLCGLLYFVDLLFSFSPGFLPSPSPKTTGPEEGSSSPKHSFYMVIIWASAFLILPLGFLIWTIYLFLLVWKGKKEIRTALLLSPFLLVPFFNTALAGSDYLRGTGALKLHGLPTDEAYNLDPTYRCYRDPQGCVVTLWTVLTTYPYNQSLKGLIETFGPMSGFYTGPYPSREVVLERLKNSGKTFTRQELEKGKINFKDREYKISLWQLEKGVPLFRIGEKVEKFRIAQWKNCLFVLPIENFSFPSIAIVDTKGREVFAAYHDIPAEFAAWWNGEKDRYLENSQKD